MFATYFWWAPCSLQLLLRAALVCVACHLFLLPIAPPLSLVLSLSFLLPLKLYVQTPTACVPVWQCASLPPLPTICPFHDSPSRDWYHLKLILFLLLVTFFLNCYCFAQFCFSLLFHKIHFTHMHQHLLVFYSLIPCALVLYLCWFQALKCLVWFLNFILFSLCTHHQHLFIRAYTLIINPFFS